MRLGVDVGSVRVGVARCDPSGVIATPVTTLARRGKRGGVAEIAGLVREDSAIEVVIGLPRALDGHEGSSARQARAYAGQVARAVEPVPVRLVDERLSTVAAHRAMHEAGRAGRRHREVVDQAAAVVILQSALDAERATGAPPGEHVVPARPETGGTMTKEGSP
ncbi:Holliday junction resolvase YqgF [Beutenbergia cavernae DSM 12333]|uniref:Putative pre-16S rRNA nuclease n=1 Tax=Beutenbergia cavernae (strain ATCC BAA-8 / DSM 12333 / CCUG 43141 / JCM 11478 / NBRC 16432 / NCIMB 13614 / HKI 0122) TaxID=471853 RepID=C5C5S9_BEUC1|nr:Holliday junction resolvase YqgF [Beutenbergia cavernae DSM 12333]